MRFVNKDKVYLKVCFNVFGDRISSVSAGSSALITRAEGASPWPDLLEFTAGSNVYIVFKHDI